jgi:hypothetical protein
LFTNPAIIPPHNNQPIALLTVSIYLNKSSGCGMGDRLREIGVSDFSYEIEGGGARLPPQFHSRIKQCRNFI